MRLPLTFRFDAGPHARHASRARSWLLLVAIVPSLTFLGHWPELRVDIPGTNSYLVLPGGEADHASGHSHNDAGGPAEEHQHEQHCHANVASCSDIPFTGVSAFAMLAAAVAFLAISGQLVLVSPRIWQPERALQVDPSTPPPKRVALA